MEHSSASYKEGLAKILANLGVATNVRKDRGLCFAKRDAEKVNAAARELDRHFYAVASLMSDSCVEQAVVEWAAREGLVFQVRELKEAGGRSRGKLINIYSFSADEAAANKKKLKVDAPLGETCIKG